MSRAGSREQALGVLRCQRPVARAPSFRLNSNAYRPCARKIKSLSRATCYPPGPMVQLIMSCIEFGEALGLR